MTENSNEALEGERQKLLAQIRELDHLREELPVRQEIAEQKRLLEKQKAYRNSLGWFHGRDRKRIEEQMRIKREEITNLEVLLENSEHEIEDRISDLGLAVQAIETELERRSDQKE